MFPILDACRVGSRRMNAYNFMYSNKGVTMMVRRSGHRARWGTLSVLVLGLSMARAAHADPATAQALFDRGRELMRAKSYAEACPKLEESMRQDPSPGTQLLLGLCRAAEGKTATAWSELKKAEALATTAKRTKDADRAKSEVAKLQKALSWLTIEVSVSAASTGLVVQRDGVDVPAAAWGVAVPVDPGKHTLTATAPGRKRWERTVEIKADGTRLSETVPVLEEMAVEPVVTPATTAVIEPPPPPPPAPTPTVLPPPKPAEPPPPAPVLPDPQRVKLFRTIGLVSGGAGVVGLGVGLGLRLYGAGKIGEGNADCPLGVCQSMKGVQAYYEGVNSANAGTAVLIAGGVVAAGGAAVFFLSPVLGTPNKGVTQVGLSPNGAWLGGSW